MNFEPIANQYKVPVAQVEQKYKEFITTARDVIAKKYPTEVDKKLEEYFVKNVSNIFQMSAYDRAVKRAESGDTSKLQCIIFGVKPSEDKYGVEKRVRKNKYYADPQAEIGSGRVVERTNPDGKKYPVAVDNNEYKVNFEGKPILDEAGNPIPNPNFNQDIQTFWINKLLMLVDNKVMIGSIPSNRDTDAHSPRVGYKSTVYGSIFQNKYVTISKDGYEDAGRFEGNSEFPNGTYDVAKKYLEAMEEFTTLKKLETDEPYKMRIVKGNMINRGETEFGSYVIINDMEVPSGIKFSTSYQPIRDDIKRIPKGAECYVIFDRRRWRPKDKDEVITFNKLWGVIPASNDDALQNEIAALLG